jgi:hypothetical protein
MRTVPAFPPGPGAVGGKRSPGRPAIALLVAIYSLLLQPVSTAAAAPADDPDEAALALADRTQTADEKARDLRAFLELGLGSETDSPSGRSRDDHRVSFDLRLDTALARDWRAALADRLDVSDPAQSDPGPHAINTLQNAFVSWQAGEGLAFDAGRVNVHEGVAQGYNPTDVLREGAVRSVVSIDPASLRENRQGSVLLRAQVLRESGSAWFAWSPRLGEASHDAGWNPDLHATNPRGRAILSLSPRISELWSSQWLVVRDGDHPLQWGANLSALAGEATVLYLEWLGGRSPSLAHEVLAPLGRDVADDTAFRNRLALGGTWTSTDKLGLTAELDFDGAALGSPDWQNLPRLGAQDYLAYRLDLFALREPPTRRAIFLMARWQDAFLPRLDLSALQNIDAIDHSRRNWLEARYHLDRTEFALQWQHVSGSVTSNYGASPQSTAWMLSFRAFR